MLMTSYLHLSSDRSQVRNYSVDHEFPHNIFKSGGNPRGDGRVDPQTMNMQTNQ